LSLGPFGATTDSGAGAAVWTRFEPPSPVSRLSVQLGLVVLVCIAVYWVRLGANGFIASEGHRVLPAWSMLDSGDYLVPRLFEQVYLRKPPGMFWALAGSSALLGRTEFAARAVSAAAMTAGAVVSLLFARRWFGGLYPPAGLVAGLAHALSPWFWQFGRTAEIESLHQLCVQVSVLLLIDLLVSGRERGVRAAHMTAVGAGLSMAAMVLVKGPAGVPAIVAAVAAPCLVRRSLDPLRSRPLRVAVLVAVLVIVAVFAAIFRALARSGEGAVAQSLDEFLWSAEGLAGMALLLPTALASALPMSFALLYPWGRAMDPGAERTNQIARTLAWVCLLSLLIYLFAGVTNRRYVLPSFSILAPLAAWATSRIAAGVLVGVPIRLGRAVLLDRPAGWFIGMIVFAGVWILIVEGRRVDHGGREPGRAVADLIAAHPPVGPELWADDAVEARPDLLAYARRDLGEQGIPLRIRWVQFAESPQFPPAGSYVLLRADGTSDELKYWAAGLEARAELLGMTAVRDFQFSLYRVKEP
jgi:4-amino-4-deoxy-L-arabinose transferase-like glycosyltransferase